MEGPKDARELGFDRGGSFIQFSPDNPESWHDVMGREYKQCAKCKKFYPAGSFPACKATGRPSKCCQACLDKAAAGREKRKEKRKEQDAGEAAVRARAKPEPGKEHDTAALAGVPDSEIIKEIRRRGWKGRLVLTMEFNL